MNDIRPSARPPASAPPRFDDEIDLVDLGLALWRRRFLVLGFLLAGLVLGALLSLVPRDDHRVSAVLTVGKISDGGEPRLVESTDSVIDWLNGSLLPAAARRQAREEGVEAGEIDLSAKGGNGNGIVLEGRTPEKLIDAHVEAIEWAAARVAEIADQPIRDRESRLESDRRNLELKIDRLQDADRLERERLALEQQLRSKQDELEALADREESVRQQIDRLERMVSLLEERAAGVHRYLDSRPRDTAEGAESATDAMTAMLIGNEVQRQMDRLASLNEQITVELPARIRQAQDSLAEIEREQRQVETDIEEARLALKAFETSHRRDVEQIELAIEDKQAQLDNLQRTSLLNEPQVGREGAPDAPLLTALGAVLGLFVGLFAALFANFIATARERLHAERSDQNDEPDGPSDA